MRYLFTLICFLCIYDLQTVVAQGSMQLQHLVSPQQVRPFMNPQRGTLPASRWRSPGSRGIVNQSFYIDYDSADLALVNPLNPSQDYVRYLWELNRNIPNTSNFSLRWAAQIYDSLYDVLSGRMYPRGWSSVRVDSFDVVLQHQNVTGRIDTLIFTIYNKNAATRTGTGAAEVYNTPVLWADTLYTNTSLTLPGNYGTYTGRPNISLPQGETFGIRVDFRGDTANKFFVLAGYRDTCAAACGAVNSVVPNNALYYINYTLPGGGANISGINSLVFNCTPCSQFILQNFYFIPYVTLGVNCPNAFVNTTPTGCGASTGRARVSLAGNNAGPYTYAWNVPGSPNRDSITGLAAGSYQVTVTGRYGCTASATGNVSSSNAPNVSSTASALNCFGQTNGSVSLNVSGGTPPYNISWSNSGSGNTISGLSAGIYTATVTDAANCAAVVSDTVISPTQALAIASSSNISCKGAADGSIDINVQGATPPYNFQWSDNGTGAQRSGLAAGTYSLVLTDANNCAIANSNFTITEPAILSGSVLSLRNVRCFGQQNGSARIAVVGGTPQYSINWSNTAQGDSLNGLAAGTYAAWISDANGCTDTLDVIITEPVQLAATPGSSDASGANNGRAWVTVSGGTAPYTFSWNPAGSGDTISGLAPGNYSVTVTDANQCNANATSTVGGSSSTAEIGSLGRIQMYPNPAKSEVMLEWSGSGRLHRLKIFASDGSLVFATNEIEARQQKLSLDVSRLASGIYVVEAETEGSKGHLRLMIE